MQVLAFCKHFIVSHTDDLVFLKADGQGLSAEQLKPLIAKHWQNYQHDLTLLQTTARVTLTR